MVLLGIDIRELKKHSSKVRKGIESLPTKALELFELLLDELEKHGPIAKGFLNFERLSRLKNINVSKSQKIYHCHLTKDHAWVCVWISKVDKQGRQRIISMEVVYVGEHKSAPY